MNKAIVPDFNSVDLIQRPLPYYKNLREHPIAFDPTKNRWIVSKYEDVQRILRDPRFKTDRMNDFQKFFSPEHQRELDPLFKFVNHWLVFKDGPAQQTVRNPLVRALAMQAQRSYGQVLREEVEIAFTKIGKSNEVDLLTELVEPFPLKIICRIMGLPVEDGRQVKAWIRDLIHFLDVSTDVNIARTAWSAAQSLTAYLLPHWDGRTDDGKMDLMTLLKKIQSENPDLSKENIISNFSFIFMAGHETVTSTLANGISLLLENRDQWELLKAQPALIPGAVEEILRYDSAIQRLGRAATEDVSWNAQHSFKAGDLVSILLGAANHDPAEFVDPDRFMIQREKNRHLAFSGGDHYCIGAQLARMEVAAILERLIQEYPDMSLTESNQPYFHNATFRCRASVKVKLR